MKKAFFTLIVTSALACANDVVYDFFSQDMSDLSTGTTWGADAQGHSGSVTSGYKNESNPTTTGGTNWTDGETTKNTTSKVANLKLIVTAVPEPTTATLSLLALAGLCARRRR